MRRTSPSISESLAKTQWPGQDPIGRFIQFGNMDGDMRGFRIVGVVGDVRELSPETVPGPIFYGYYQQRATSRVSIVAQSGAAPAAPGDVGTRDRAPGRSRSADPAADGRGRARPRARGPPLQPAADRRLQRLRARSRDARRLRPDGVPRGAADAGNRHPPGARRRADRRHARWWWAAAFGSRWSAWPSAQLPRSG